MKDHPHRRERFLRDPLPIRLGGIAANLARVASFAAGSPSVPVVDTMLYESKFFIEWAAPTAPIETAAALVELQIAIAVWQRRWSKGHANVDTRNSLIRFAREWSDRLLDLSGLLNEPSGVKI